MPHVTVGLVDGTVRFAPNGGDVTMRGRGKIVFTPDPQNPVIFQSFKLNPEDQTQFPRTVGAAQIDVDDLFTDKQEKRYTYTIEVTAPGGSTKVGDPQIVNQPGAMVGVR